MRPRDDLVPPCRAAPPSAVFGAALLAVAGACSGGAPLVTARDDAALLIADTTVLDVVAGSLTGHRDVLVRDGRIAAVTEAGSAPPPADARRLDGAGATLLPGLIDSHVHTGTPVAAPWDHPLPDEAAILASYLYCGVTTVLDTGGINDTALRRRDQVAAGDLLGPRIFAVGPVLTARGGHPVPMLRTLPWWQELLVVSRQTRQLDGPADVPAVIEEVAGYGADFVKVVLDRIPDPQTPRLSRELVAEVVAQAKAKGLRVLAHVGSTEDALDAGAAGAAAWMHVVNRERIPDEQIPALAAFGIPLVPTLVVFDHYGELLHQPPPPTVLERETADPALFAALAQPPPDGALEQRFRTYMDLLRAEAEHRRDNLRRLHAAGVTVLAGSDAHAANLPGPALHRELELLVQAGLSPMQAIQAATVVPARFLTRQQDPGFGVIAVGKQADLLLVEGDPTTDIRVISRIRAVVRDGRLLTRHPRPETSRSPHP